MLTLAGYGYSLIYRPSKEMYCADMLSRLPLPITIPEPPQSGDIHLMANVIHDEVPVTAKQIACATNSNPDLSQIKRCVMSGDWTSLAEGVKPYLIWKDGLSIDVDCLLWGSRVIILPKLHRKTISELHNAHPGIVTMKAVVRAHVLVACPSSTLHPAIG